MTDEANSETQERVTRILARPLIQAGMKKEPGDEVLLRPDQIERLEPEGYFRPAAKRKGAK